METNTSPSLSPLKNAQIDVSEYEKLNIEGYQDKEEINPETEKKIEYLLLKVLFVGKMVSLMTFVILFCFVGYSWSRNQKQDSWVMKQAKYVYQGSTLCNWVNAGNNRKINASTDFMTFLERNPGKDLKTDLKKLLTDNTCLTPDSFSHLLGMEEKYMTEKLKEAYETTLIKKFLGNTIESSDEISTILALDPANRMKHVEVLKLIIEKVQKGTIRGKSTVTCGDIRFKGLSTDISCTIKSIPPIQPRDEAIRFLESLEETNQLLVSYPNSFNLNADTRDDILSTSFNVNLIYMPARYESEVLKKI